MNILTKAQLLYRILRWRLSWYRQNTRFAYTVPGNPKFMGPRDAIRNCVRDGDVVGLSGLGGNMRATVLYYATRDVFLETGHPRDLTVVAIGGIGGRGRLPGTVEEFAHVGLTKRFITGHMETYKAMLRLADQGHIELQCLPQAPIAFLLDGQGRGESSFLTETGTGTFMDPRVGRGSPLAGEDAEQLVTVEGDRLRYEIPKINVAMFNAPAADREGNIYVKNCAMIAESREIAKAARYNGGKVIVNVGVVVDKGYDEVFLPAEDVDAIVVYRGTEQTGSVQHRKPLPLFTTESDMPIEEAVEWLRFINDVLRITPRRKGADFALARLAADIFTRHAKKGSFVNIGVGLPEEVCRLIFDGGLVDEITLFTESGVIGGLPAPGVFFGAGICPTKIISSAEVFRRVYQRLDVTVVGALQVDSSGNVNVSKRGQGAINYVGPGGFIDLTTAAKMVIFVSHWMEGAKIRVDGNRVSVVKPGKVKFIDQVDEITFSGAQAVKTDKKVFYVTDVGAFRLTSRGMELVNVLPGIDVKRDILDPSPMKIVLPESGDVPVVDDSIVTGEGFALSFAE